ncbi:MAG: polyprenyl synthetase family protein [bacterium]
MEIRSFKKTFDAQLQIYVKKKIREAQKIASRPRTQQILAYIDDAVFAAGKRLRPYLIYTSYMLYGGKATKEVMHFSQSAELIHTMALIHDDIIDKGEMRHGKPCFYKFASDIFPSAPNKDHLGISQALLV